MRAKLGIFLACLIGVMGWAGPAGADTSSSSLTNQAIVQLTGTNQVDHDLAWSQAQVNQPLVTAVNEATATATDCLTCTAEAVAFQIVIASNTSTYALTNTATSSNTRCVNCTTVSVAEQWVVGDTDQALRLNLAGQIRLFAVHLELAFWTHVPPAQGLPHILALAEQVSDILSQDIVVVPGPVPTPLSPVSRLAVPVPSGPTVQHNVQVSQ